MLSLNHCTAILQHIVASTLAASRQVPVNEVLAELGRGSDDLREGGAALDSLDQLSVAREVAEFFELEKTGAEELLLRRSRLEQWSELIVECLEDRTLTELWFRSGGTTGDPKLFPQPVDRLYAEVREIAELVGSTRRIIALVPLHHIYGCIWGPLLSSKLNVPLVHGPEAIRVIHHEQQPGDLVVGVPEWWQYLEGGRHSLPEGVRGVTSTAPCSAELIGRLLDRGLTSMIEVYGSSETGGIGWRDDTGNGYQLFGHWSKQDDDHLKAQSGNSFPLPDQVVWQTDRLLTPVRRRDGAVQIGGVNVWPDRVRSLIENHYRVRACAVRPTETGTGTRLKAFVVPARLEPDHADDTIAAELQDWFRTSLSAAERPVQLTLGEILPRNGIGKLCDW